MRKIPTVFRRDPEDMKRVTREVHPDCQWVLDGEGVATRKYDGTCVMLDDDGAWWARREVKPGKTPPADYVPVSTDETTGKTVGWEPIGQSAFAKYHAEALENTQAGLSRLSGRPAGTYELVGPKINGNPERVDSHQLIRHANAEVIAHVPRDFDWLAKWMPYCAYEGVVWHHPDGRMAKLKKRDFPSVALDRIPNYGPAPDWLIRLFPDVRNWEPVDIPAPHIAVWWRGRSPEHFIRDQWIYVFRDRDDYASTEVAGEFVETDVFAKDKILRTLCGQIKRQRAAVEG